LFLLLSDGDFGRDGYFGVRAIAHARQALSIFVLYNLSTSDIYVETACCFKSRDRIAVVLNI
jgi:hypothetical protein